MKRILALAFVLAVTAGSANAAKCTDPTSHKFIKCLPPAAAAAATTTATGPVCKVGKACGKSCISKDKVCHKT